MMSLFFSLLGLLALEVVNAGDWAYARFSDAVGEDGSIFEDFLICAQQWSCSTDLEKQGKQCQQEL